MYRTNQFMLGTASALFAGASIVHVALSNYVIENVTPKDISNLRGLSNLENNVTIVPLVLAGVSAAFLIGKISSRRRHNNSWESSK